MFLPSSLSKRQSIAIDLGNNKTVISDCNEVLAHCPTWITFNRATKTIKAIGELAYEMHGKSNDELKTVKPLQGGVIADFTSASMLIKAMIRQSKHAKPGFFGYNNLISGVPLFSSEVERKAVRDTLDQFQAKNKYLIFEPVAAAIGMGLNLNSSRGILILDIGGGITELVLISFSGVVISGAIKIAGDSIDLEIQEYFRRNYFMAIGIRTAEEIKKKIGVAYKAIDAKSNLLEVKGKDLLSGVPRMQQVDGNELIDVIDKPILKIEELLLKTLNQCPPDLAADIYKDGIYVTGGSSQLKGLKERLNQLTGLRITIDDNAALTVGKGIKTVLQNTANYKHLLLA